MKFGSHATCGRRADRLRLRSALAAVTVICVLAFACGRSPAQPTPQGSSSTTTVPPTNNVTGRLVDGISDQPVVGATVQVDGLGQTTSGADGAFVLASAASSSAVRSVTVTSPQTVDRLTWARVPAADLSVSLIPTALNLVAFEQMCRSNGAALRRWTEAPRLIIQRRLLKFVSTGDTSYTALSTLMSDEEVEELRQDLTWALPQLTGNTFAAFASVTTEAAEESQQVPAGVTGAIVAARVEGLKAATSSDGYTRWSWNNAGAIRSGFIMLDRGYEISGSRGRRALRAHEMGHALGYNHVSALASVMQQLVQTEPNQFDRDASRLAFARPLLNRSPDTDPAPGSTSAAVAEPGRYWSGAP